MNKAFFLFLLAAFCGVITGPMAGYVRAAEPASKPTVSASAGTYGDYVLQPGDKIAVQVYDQPALNDMMKGLIIAQDYTIMLPHLSEPLNLSGKTLRQAEQAITDRYKPDYLKNPSIKVAVVEHVSRTVKVMGAVLNQKVVPIDPDKGLKLMEAIVQAGGFNNVAKKTNVRLERTNPDGTKSKYTIDTTKPMKDPQGNNDWPLQPDDIVDVQEILL